jgi:hypothetical protein
MSCQLSLQSVAEVRPAIERIARRDRDVAKQLTGAATLGRAQCGRGLGLTWSEPGARWGAGTAGADRAHLQRVALGSLREVRTCLDIALRIGEPVAVALRGALLYGASR